LWFILASAFGPKRKEEQFKIGRQIAEQLKLSNYRVAQGPPVLGHGSGWSRASG
jgi:hypothetical protein